MVLEMLTVHDQGLIYQEIYTWLSFGFAVHGSNCSWLWFWLFDTMTSHCYILQIDAVHIQSFLSIFAFFILPKTKTWLQKKHAAHPPAPPTPASTSQSPKKKHGNTDPRIKSSPPRNSVLSSGTASVIAGRSRTPWAGRSHWMPSFVIVGGVSLCMVCLP